MKPYRTILALGLLYASSAAAGGICIDCVTKHPSTAPINANDQIRGHVDESQWQRWNANREADDAAALARKAHETAERAQEASARANRAIERSANAAANESNARAGAISRMYQPSPFKAGNNYGY